MYQPMGLLGLLYKKYECSLANGTMYCSPTVDGIKIAYLIIILLFILVWAKKKYKIQIVKKK